MVPHPELCFAAARVTDAFKPGEAGKVELLDGTVSGGTIVSTCAEGEQIFCSNAVVAIAAAPLAPLAGILLAGWAVIEGAAGELHHRRGKAHAAAPGPLPAVGGAPHVPQCSLFPSVSNAARARERPTPNPCTGFQRVGNRQQERLPS